LKINVFSHNLTISFNTKELSTFNFYLLKIIHRFVMNWIGKESKKIPCWINMLIHNKPFRMVKLRARRMLFTYLIQWALLNHPQCKQFSINHYLLLDHHQRNNQFSIPCFQAELLCSKASISPWNIFALNWWNNWIITPSWYWLI
jgi:hypothetical protein